MSVHSESLEMTTPDAANQEAESAPELEYKSVRNDSLSMFGAAIGGAILGMLLTLLVLAMINGGTCEACQRQGKAISESPSTNHSSPSPILYHFAGSNDPGNSTLDRAHLRRIA